MTSSPSSMLMITLLVVCFSFITFTNAILVQEEDQGCLYTNHTLGIAYNLTSLHSDTRDITTQDDQYFYYINPCSRVKYTDCIKKNSDMAVCQLTKDDGPTYQSLGLYANGTGHTTEIWDTAHIDQGVKFTYTNGDVCNSTHNYTTIVIYACAPINTTTSLTVTRNQCLIGLNILSNAACGIFNHSSSSSSSSSASSSSSSGGSTGYPSSSSSSAGSSGHMSSTGHISSTGTNPNGEESSSHGFTAMGFGIGLGTGLGIAALIAILYTCCKRRRHPYSLNSGAGAALLDDEV